MEMTSKDIAVLERELVKNIDKLCEDEKMAKQLSRIIANKLRPVRKVLAEYELWERTRS